ncbi:MAG: transporter substrate-binding domain-containing protein [Methanospirillaceae archaeon]|nr:transporter substrate-binding domain-containing protein [Methanospirillaceae archaeon]
MNVRIMGYYTVIAGIVLACLVFPVYGESDEYNLSDLVFLTEEFPPFQFAKDGVVTGLTTDILHAIGEEAGFLITDADISLVPLQEGLSTVRETPGTVIFSVAKTPEREDLYRWVGPFTSYDIVLYAKRSNPVTIKEAEDLRSYTIGAVTGDVSGEMLLDLGMDPGSLRTDPDPRSLFTMLDEGTIDLLATGDAAGNYFAGEIGQRPGLYRIVYQIDSIPLYFAFHKDTPDAVTDSFTDALDRISQAPPAGEMSRIDEIISTWVPSRGLSALTYYTEEYPPYNFKENGDVSGISADILREVFSFTGADSGAAKIIHGPWDTGYNTVLDTPGTVLFSTARSEERNDLFLWAGPVITDKSVIFGLNRSGSTGNGFCDEKKLRIGTVAAVTDDISGDDLRAAGYRDILYAQDIPSLVTALEDGTIDGFAYAYLPGMSLIEQYAKDPDAIVPLCTLDTHEYYYACNRDVPAPIVTAFQETLDLIKTEKDQDGVSMYERILYRYIEPGYATSVITPLQVQELVSYTADTLSRDAEKTLSDINAGRPPFLDAEQPDLYVFVYDTNATMVAHAANPSMVGANYQGKTDVTGKPFRDEIMQGALANGTGWVDYLYSSPAETGLFWKTTAYELVRGSDGREFVVCSGMYKTHEDTGI